MCVNSSNHSVVRFPVLDVVAYLAANGLVEVRTKP
jgi:hypothetical protein